jgi:sulfane dehydrogenase subunit SoxC
MGSRRKDEPDLPVAAGGGLMHRRLFLRAGGGLAGAGLLTAFARPVWADTGEPASPTLPAMPPATPPWMLKPGEPFSNYGVPSPHEKRVIRWISANADVPGNGISWTPLHDLEGTITPNGLHFERHHDGVPQVDPARHRLLIHGLVKRPLLYTVESLLRYPVESRLCFIECGGNSNAGWNPEPLQTRAGYMHGLASCAEWTGVPLAVLLDEAGLEPSARWLLAEGADPAAVSVSIPLDKVLEDGMLALYQNGERLRPENGYPMRLVLPGFEAITHIKWVRRLKAVTSPVMTRDETAKYTEIMPDGKARQFTFVMDAKSFITAPSPGMLLPRPGLYQITGLAWSGRGKIARVDVSADGGRSWAEAALQEPVLRHCFTRFRLPWKWDGRHAILQSRAVDETGYVQPTRERLVALRGTHGYFHYNAIVSWSVSQEGEIRHVYA